MCSYTFNFGAKNPSAKALAAAASPSAKKSAGPWQPFCHTFGWVWACLPSWLQTLLRYLFFAVCSVVALLLAIRFLEFVGPPLRKDAESYMVQPLQYVTGSVFGSAISVMSCLDNCEVRGFSSTQECTTVLMEDAQTMEKSLSDYNRLALHVYCQQENATAHRSSLCANLNESCRHDNNDTLCGQTLKQLCERASKSFVAQRGWACDWKDTVLNGLAVIAVFAVIAVLIMFASRAIGSHTDTVQFTPATTANGTACKKCLRLGKFCPQHK